jgi:DNA-binding protein HU-beta
VIERLRRAEFAAFELPFGALGRRPRAATGLPKSSPATPEIARGSWKSVGNGFTVSSSRSNEDHWFRRFCMNKAELIDVLTEKLGSDRRQATAAVENVVDTIVRAVHKGDSVTITGFGVFEQRRRAARVARNPRTGETVKVKPTSVPAFRPGAQFKAVVSGAQRLPAEGPAVKRGVTAGGGARKAVKKAAVKKAVRKAAVKKVVKRAAVKKAVKKAAVKKAVKRTAAKTAVKRTAAKTAVKKAAVKKAVTKAPARKAAVKKAAAKKTARKAPAKRGRR